MADCYRNQSAGIRAYHTSASARAAYTYVPSSAALPALYTQEHEPDPLVRVKLFDPQGAANWFLIEWDGEARAFGLCCIHEAELGYVDLDELSAYRGAFRLPIERDIHFQPTRLSVIRKEYER
jgi:hypothetical protein